MPDSNGQPQPLPSLPLAWFEFRDRPEPLAPLSPGVTRTSMPTFHDGAPITSSITVDGRQIPFKFLRLSPPSSPSPPSSSSAISSNFVSALSPRPVLVLLHGMGITVGSFHGVAPWLWASHDLLLLDYNSFSCPETWPHGGVSLRLLAAGVWRVINALDLPRVSFIGSSLGGGLALMATQMNPFRVDRVVLVNPAVYPQKLPGLYRLARTPIVGELLMALTPAESLVEGVAQLGYTAPEKMSDEIRGCYTRNMALYRNRLQLMDVIRHLPVTPGETADFTARLRYIRQPVLILWGLQERLLLPDTGRRLAADLPNAKLVEFPDLAHLPHDEEPGRLGPIMAEFLVRPAPSAASANPAEPPSEPATPTLLE